MSPDDPKVAFLKVLDNVVYNRLDMIAEKRGLDTNKMFAHFQKHGTDISKDIHHKVRLTQEKVQSPKVPVMAST